MLTVPFNAEAVVTVSGSPSTSLSLPRTLMLFNGVSSSVLTGPSFSATGASLTGRTVTLTVALAVPP